MVNSMEQHCDPTDIFYTKNNRKGSCEKCTTCEIATYVSHGSPSTAMVTHYSNPSVYNENKWILFEGAISECKYAYDSRLGKNW